jgi:hypothetical protein
MRYRLLGISLLLFVGLSSYSAQAAETGGIPVGTTLPSFKLEGPTDATDQGYLGLKESNPFTLSQVSSKLFIIDFFSSM